MTIADLIQSTIDSSKERIKTPITGAFICSFVVYNWQPILILFFSESNIELRIKVAKKYFDIISFLWPIGMALSFTILIPLLMWGLDCINIFAKKKRLAKSFENRRNLISEKINIADDVNKLKHAESGNKEKQDFIDQIESLKESNIQITATNKSSIEQLNSKLKEANETIEDLNKTIQTFRNFQEISSEYANIPSKKPKKALIYNDDYKRELNDMANGKFAKWQIDQILSMRYKVDGNLDLTNIDESLLKNLQNIDVVVQDDNGNFKFTNHAKDFINYLKELQHIEASKLGNIIKQ